MCANFLCFHCVCDADWKSMWAVDWFFNIVNDRWIEWYFFCYCQYAAKHINVQLQIQIDTHIFFVLFCFMSNLPSFKLDHFIMYLQMEWFEYTYLIHRIRLYSYYLNLNLQQKKLEFIHWINEKIDIFSYIWRNSVEWLMD